MNRIFKCISLLLCLAVFLTGCGATADSTQLSSDSAVSDLAEPQDAASDADGSAEAASAAETEERQLPEVDMTVAWDEEFTASVFAMDTYMDLKAYGPGAQEGLALITEEISELEKTLSVTSEGSEIYAVNQGAGTAVPVSGTTLQLIRDAVALGDTTGGALDISLYPVLTAWGFTTESYQIPDAETLAELLRNVNDNEIMLDEAAGTVTVPEGMEIDLGSVVKGYVGDQAVGILEALGVTSALLNLGGSTIRVLGSKLDGSDWRVAIQDPDNTLSYAGVLSVSGCAVDTSGGYERYFEDEDGNVYWHILDPETGSPAKSGVISATIISPDSFTGDGLSTACFVMGLEDTIAYWREHGGFEFVLITDDNEIYASEGIADSFTPYGSYENNEVHVVPFAESGD